ncbi:MAG: hypothetical protein Ct9H300mP1_06120 [Planctomycetaceae bacterium]|nr:MAG: hypothetical protein Ct9H300mP1_06120 [Planctomycetaceae bacterium]
MVSAADVDYASQIKSVFKHRCYACHGALKQEAGLRLDSGQLIRKGSENGVIVQKAAVEASGLLKRVTAKDPAERMPPIGMPLEPGEIAAIRNWIAAGSPSPVNEKPEADPRDHWSFRPPVGPKPLPTISRPGVGLQCCRPLCSCPVRPTETETGGRCGSRGPVETGAPGPGRSSAVIRTIAGVPGPIPRRPITAKWLIGCWRLLAMGNAGGALDGCLALFGLVWPSQGRRCPQQCAQIWRWRDWIIDSLNRDKSYAQMVREMLAADELSATDDSAWPATGYLIRNYFSLNPNDWMRHSVEYTGKAFLGLTFNCAHCHDHKYDPITHEDYFRMRAFFEPMGVRQDRVPGQPGSPSVSPVRLFGVAEGREDRHGSDFRRTS